jgi:hypothetical protein
VPVQVPVHVQVSVCTRLQLGEGVRELEEGVRRSALGNWRRALGNWSRFHKVAKRLQREENKEAYYIYYIRRTCSHRQRRCGAPSERGGHKARIEAAREEKLRFEKKDSN